MITLSHIIFYVNDVLKSVEFYKDAFNIQPKFIHESNQYAELNTGATLIAFASDELGSMNLPNGYIKNDQKTKPLGCEITFTVTNVHNTFDYAKKCGALEVTPPAQKPWGQTVAYVRDPNGVLIEIASQMK